MLPEPHNLPNWTPASLHMPQGWGPYSSLLLIDTQGVAQWHKMPSWRPALPYLTAHSRLQEHKLLVKREELPQAQQEIQSRLDSGLDYNTAASTVYQDYGTPVNDLDSWTDYQAIEGSMDDEHVVVSLQYVEEGLLTVDLVEGQGAFGDDLAIEILATDYQREIFVVSAPRRASVAGLIARKNEIFSALMRLYPHRPNLLYDFVTCMSWASMHMVSC